MKHAWQVMVAMTCMVTITTLMVRNALIRPVVPTRGDCMEEHLYDPVDEDLFSLYDNPVDDTEEK